MGAAALGQAPQAVAASPPRSQPRILSTRSLLATVLPVTVSPHSGSRYAWIQPQRFGTHAVGRRLTLRRRLVVEDARESETGWHAADGSRFDGDISRTVTHITCALLPLSPGRWWVVRRAVRRCCPHDKRPHGAECGNREYQLTECGLPRGRARVVSPSPRFALHLPRHVGCPVGDAAGRRAPMQAIVGLLPLAHVVPPGIHVLRRRSRASRTRSTLPPRTPRPRGR